MSESQSDSLSEAQADTILRKSRFLFGGRLAICWSRKPSICQKTLFFLCVVINKDVTPEEVQRVDDLVSHLESQGTEYGLQTQVF